jgi:hypothetical protein
MKGWHTFGLWWNPNEYVFFVDGKETWRTNAGGVSQVPEYIKLSDEIGDWAGDVKKAKLPDAFLVDYVRVYDVVDSETADDPFRLHAPPDAIPPVQGKPLQAIEGCEWAIKRLVMAAQSASFSSTRAVLPPLRIR